MVKLKFLFVTLLMVATINVWGQESFKVEDFYLPEEGTCVKILGTVKPSQIGKQIVYTPKLRSIVTSMIMGETTISTKTVTYYASQANSIVLDKIKVSDISGHTNNYVLKEDEFAKDPNSIKEDLILPPSEKGKATWTYVDFSGDKLSLESMYEDIVFDGKPLKTIKVVRRIKGTSFCEIYYYGYKKGLIKEDVVKENGQIETLFKLKKIYKL